MNGGRRAIKSPGTPLSHNDPEEQVMSSVHTLARWLAARPVTSARSRARRATPKRERSAGNPHLYQLDPLEQRTMLSLLGLPLSFPEIAYDSTGRLAYTASNQTFDLTATALGAELNSSSPPVQVQNQTPPGGTNAAQSLQVHIKVDSNGNLIGGLNPGDPVALGSNNAPNDLDITGWIDTNGNAIQDAGDYYGTLLTGNVTGFGYQFTNTSDTSGTPTNLFDFSFTVTGGAMASLFGANAITMQVTSEDSTFTGSFASDFTGHAKGTVGSTPASIPSVAPAINTTQQPATASVGSSIADQATVSGGDSPTGTVTFKLYSNATATGTALFTDTEALVGGVATSAGYLAAATGTDYWVATYNGDSNNSAVTSGTAAEPVSITPVTPAINTAQQPATASVGTSIADKATVSGGDNPTGTVTFKLYNNSAATGTALFTDTETLAGGVATSAGYLAAATGTDYWVATYNGDSNNSAVTSGTAAEPVSITPVTPAINTTQQPATASVGTSIADKATVSGGDSPTGTVTFKLYNNSAATGTALFTDTEALAGGVATSAGYLAAATGTDYWVATYNGDSNNSAVTSGTAAEPVSITPAIDVISGYKYQDLTGNGFSPDDTPFAGVTIDLFQDKNGDGVLTSADGAPVQTAVTNANGYYSFTVAPNQTYFVEEVVPANTIRTGPALTPYYTVKVTGVSGFTSTGNNFDDYILGPCACNLSCIYYVLNNNNCVTYTDLSGNTHEGDQVEVYFTVASGSTATLSLVSYTAPDPYFNANDASQQAIFDVDTGTFSAGTHCLSVTLPLSDYQIDFVCGLPIDHLGPAGSNIFYTPQKRLIDSDNSGWQPVVTNPASLSGYVYLDANNNGTFDSGEQPIANVVVTLTGKDNLGDSISLTRCTAADGSYSFLGLRPGTYTLTETTPAGYLDGKDTIGSQGGTTSQDKFSNIVLTAGTNGVNNDFGELSQLDSGDTGCIGFWHNSSGQNLIKCLNGGSSCTNLGNWLATTFPNLYGAKCGSNNLTGKTNSQVASYYQTLYSQSGQKCAQVLATCLSVYVTNSNLAGCTTATSCGFTVNSTGSACAGYNVGSNGAAFGVSNNTSLTLLQLLLDVNNQAVNGSLYNGNSTLTNQCYTLLNALNNAGDNT
jgi:hypothetical protein